MLKTIKNNIETQIVEKKSKFIANLIHVESVKEAEEVLDKIRKLYFDARHHCYAYSILTEEDVINRFSDDGEPSGTAGAPLLNIINKNELVNVIIVVTRYFGGILLGTGGLVKAYSDALTKAIEEAQFVKEERGYEISLEINYNDLDKFKFYCSKNNINIVSTEFNEKVVCIIEVTKEEKDILLNNINDLNFRPENIKTKLEKNIQKNI